jgi:hypothetical protein
MIQTPHDTGALAQFIFRHQELIIKKKNRKKLPFAVARTLRLQCGTQIGTSWSALWPNLFLTAHGKLQEPSE